MKHGVLGLIELLGFIFIISCMACDNAVIENGESFFPIEKYNTVEKQKVLLDSILEIDQRVRVEMKLAQQKFGYQSKEHHAAIARMNEVDNLNLKLIDLYLRSYEYPSKEKYGQDANTAAWMVLHHAPGGIAIDYRERNIKYIHKAWKDGKLRPRSYAFFLGRYHNVKFGERLKLKGSYKIEYEIDTLLKKLKTIDTIRNELDSEINY